jgi:hypothetical protein
MVDGINLNRSLSVRRDSGAHWAPPSLAASYARIAVGFVDAWARCHASAAAVPADACPEIATSTIIDAANVIIFIKARFPSSFIAPDADENAHRGIGMRAWFKR